MNHNFRPNLRACFPGPHQCLLEEVELPGEPGDEEIFVECLYSLISAGTELAIFSRTHTGFREPGHSFARYPFFPGYAAVGKVRAAGGASAFAEGDLVFYAGRHQRFSLVPATSLTVRAEAGSKLTRLPFVQLATIAATARWVSRPPTASTAVVFGLGVVGNLAAQLFGLAGHRVIGVDKSASRCQSAEASGVAETIIAGAADPLQEIQLLTGGQGADLVVEATGSPAVVVAALQAARRGGEVVLLGSTRGLVELDVYSLIHHKGVTVRGAHTSVIPSRGEGKVEPRRTAVARQMLRLIEREALAIDPLISRTIHPKQMPEAYQALMEPENGPLGVIVDWSS